MEAQNPLTATDFNFVYVNGKRFTCLREAGEPRIFLSHLVTAMSTNFSEDDILTACCDLNITFKNSSDFKNKIPANSVELKFSEKKLMSVSDSERLCGVLLRKKSSEMMHIYNNELLVCHECFGGCRGNFISKLYHTTSSQCIQCMECYLLLSPSQFVAHSHNKIENAVTHWGFSSLRWRTYIFLLSCSDEQDVLRLDEMKKKFTASSKSFRDYGSKVGKAMQELQPILIYVATQAMSGNIPSHLGLDEPVLYNESIIKTPACYMDNPNYIPNVSVALFNFNEKILETKKRKLQHDHCNAGTLPSLCKDYLGPVSCLTYGLFQQLTFQKCCKHEFVEKFLHARKQFFSSVVRKIDLSKKKELMQSFHCIQKQGTDLVYFFLENKAEFSQKLYSQEMNGCYSADG